MKLFFIFFLQSYTDATHNFLRMSKSDPFDKKAAKSSAQETTNKLAVVAYQNPSFPSHKLENALRDVFPEWVQSPQDWLKDKR